MSTLLVDPLITTLEKTVYFSYGRTQIACISPYLYIHNAPAGTFTLLLEGDNSEEITISFTAAEVLASVDAVGNYAHVLYPLIPLLPAQVERGTYVIRLISSGYTYSEGSYIGWIRQHENPNDVFTSTGNDFENPLATRIKAYSRMP